MGGEAGGDNNANAAIAAASATQYGYELKGKHFVRNDDSRGHDPDPVVLYATVGYLVVAVVAVWPIGKYAKEFLLQSAQANRFADLCATYYTKNSSPIIILKIPLALRRTYSPNCTSNQKESKGATEEVSGGHGWIVGLPAPQVIHCRWLQ